MAALSRENCPTAMDGTIERIGVLSRVYGRLRRIDNASIVNAKEFLESLVEDLQQGMVGLRPIAISARADSVDLDMGTAIAVGTIANELVTNAVKYAFPDTQPGWVDLSFRREKDEYLLNVSDNGVGLTSSHPKGTGLGHQIMKQLAVQLRGKLEVRPRPEGGVQAVLQFPVPNPVKYTR
jgi:two-component sensor histidine kinase